MLAVHLYFIRRVLLYCTCTLYIQASKRTVHAMDPCFPEVHVVGIPILKLLKEKVNDDDGSIMSIFTH